MNVIAFLFILVAQCLAVHAFVVESVQKSRLIGTDQRSTGALHMAWFDKAFHGHGSANQDELDAIWKTQQAILAARKGETKEHMKHKYKEEHKFEVKATKPIHSEGNEMYVQVDKKARKKAESAGKKAGRGGAFKMPWEK